MALEAGSEIEINFIDQGVKWLFLKDWGKTVKTTKPQGAKRKFTLKQMLVLFRCKRWGIVWMSLSFGEGSIEDVVWINKGGLSRCCLGLSYSLRK
ncbi:hypothetical protein Hanom_Chr03g00209571 [Helianthus anomalus]